MNRPSPVTIAICTKGRPNLLRDCLQSLHEAGSPPFEILVVHNDDKDDGTKYITESMGANYICEPLKGLDRARNRAVQEAHGDIVAFIDDDARAEKGWIDAIRQGFRASRVLCVTGRVLAAELTTYAQELCETCKSFDRGRKSVFFSKWHFGLFFPVRAGVMGTGTNMACRREAGIELGFDPGLDVGTPTRGGGDLDFFYKVIKKGGILAYRPDAVVRHVHRRSYKELHQLRYDYGVASAAFAWKCILEYHDLLAGPFLVYKMFFHLAEITAYGLGLRRWPADLVWTELKGMFTGYKTFASARRKISS